jgi:hypothetical protein
VFYSLQNYLRTGRRDLDHPILAGAENIESWHIRKGDLQCVFLLDIMMVASSTITVTTDDERLMCGGFSLDEAIHLRSFEFIMNYFSGLSLSPRRGDSSATFMGSTHSGTPSPWWAMIEDCAKEFLMASSGEGALGLPFPRRRGTGAPIAPVATIPWLKDILDIAAAQQAKSSLQRQAKASISSPWDFSSNQLSHIPNIIFF